MLVTRLAYLEWRSNAFIFAGKKWITMFYEYDPHSTNNVVYTLGDDLIFNMANID